MRGTLSAPQGEAADGKRLVWASGNEQPLWSVNSDEFWEWTTRYIVEYAKMSAENEHIFGVFLDYENYAKGKEGNCYSLSYDDLIMRRFTAAKGVTLPTLDLDKRKSWLEAQGLHEEFSAFQIKHWRERCRALRQAVDEHDPTFQFCIYPAPGTPFMVEATYPEWATEKAPIILADPSTYGRSSRFLPQKESLAVNRDQLVRRMEVPRERGIPFIYSGGIDPAVKGADPEFSGKNAVVISRVTDGYWIFYEGPEYDEGHPEYWKWFTWANKAIARGALDVWQEPRVTPEDWSLSVLDTSPDAPTLVGPPVTGETSTFPLVKLRRDNLLLVAGKAGQSIEIVLRNIPIARYQSLLVWDLRTPKREKIATGRIPHGESGVVKLTPDVDGIYFLGVSAGSCAYSVAQSNAPVGLYAGQGLSLIYGAKRLYFSVPDGLGRFALTATGSGAETVRVNVFDPEGAQVASGQTTPIESRVTVKVSTGGRTGRAWSLEITRADKGVLEDNRLQLDPKLPPTLSFTPGETFRIRQPQK